MPFDWSSLQAWSGLVWYHRWCCPGKGWSVWRARWQLFNLTLVLYHLLPTAQVHAIVPQRGRQCVCCFFKSTGVDVCDVTHGDRRGQTRLQLYVQYSPFKPTTLPFAQSYDFVNHKRLDLQGGRERACTQQKLPLLSGRQRRLIWLACVLPGSTSRSSSLQGHPF